MPKDLCYKTLPVIYPNPPNPPNPSKKVHAEKEPDPPDSDLQPELVIRLPSIDEIRKKYRPSILSPLRQRS